MKLKKIFFMFVTMVCVLFLASNTVSAANITVDQVINGLEESTIVKYYNDSGYPLTITKDTTNHKIIIKNDTIEAYLAVDYTDDYIEYTNDINDITYEVASKSFFQDLILYYFTDVIFDLAGYEDKTIFSDDADFTNTYETYGFTLTTEDFDIQKTDEYGTETLSGTLFRHFKISLDKNKIDALIAQYGIAEDEVDPNKELIKGLTPTLEATKVTDSSVTIQPHIDYTNFNPDYDVLCYIYRSDSEDGEYVKLDGDPVSCIKTSGYIDKDLKANTTYFYKTVVTYSDKFSDPIKVTTKEAGKNPKTGINYPVITISLIMISTLMGLVVINKNRKIKQI